MNESGYISSFYKVIIQSQSCNQKGLKSEMNLSIFRTKDSPYETKKLSTLQIRIWHNREKVCYAYVRVCYAYAPYPSLIRALRAYAPLSLSISALRNFFLSCVVLLQLKGIPIFCVCSNKPFTPRFSPPFYFTI